MTEPIFLVDERKGIFVTAKDKCGLRTPIHLCKSFSMQTLDCEVEGCREFMALAVGRECLHLDRVRSLKPHTPPPLLESCAIKEMYNKGLISSARKEDCEKVHKLATEDGSVCVFPIFYGEYGYSKRYAYFSVYTGKLDSWCRFGRTRVTLDTLTGKWSCQCKGTKKIRCVHMFLSMWWTFQEKQDLLIANDRESEDSSDSDQELDAEDTDHLNQDSHISEEQIRQIVDYMWAAKRLPEKLPEELQNNVQKVPVKFSPEETKCPYCPGPTPPDLSEEKLVSRHGTVYGVLTIHKGMYVLH